MKRKRYKFFKTLHRCGLETTLSKISQNTPKYDNIIQIGAGEDGLCEKFNYHNKKTLDIDDAISPDYNLDIVNDDLSVCGKYDAIFCFEVLEHITDLDLALMNLKKLESKDTPFLFSLPFCFHIHADPNDYNRLTAEGIRVLLLKNGFHEINILNYGGYFSCIYDLIILTPSLKLLLFPLRFFSAIIYLFTLNSKSCPSGFVFSCKKN
jgi:hypothetical protein